MTHTFLERPELVPVVITCVIKERIKEIVNRTTSVRKLTLTISLWHVRDYVSVYFISIYLKSNENLIFKNNLNCIFFFLAQLFGPKFFTLRYGLWEERRREKPNLRQFGFID